MPKIEVNGSTLHYQQAGTGTEALVLVHGLTSNLAFWPTLLIAGLAARYRIILVDLRGHGYSGMPPTGYTTGSMAQDIKELLDSLDIGSAHLLGHSYGGAVALNLAILYPERVISLILADVRVRSLQPSYVFYQWPYWRVIRENLAKHGIRIDEHTPDLEFQLLEQLARHRVNGKLGNMQSGTFFVPFLYGSSRRAEQWLKLIEATTAIDDFKAVADLTPDAVRNVKQPTLAVYGELSHCLPSLVALREALPSCTDIVMRGVGH
ncbi:MAG TPA: alpha/beta hydrolase, partial [Pyrinomonadaceae bacterium]